METSEEGEDSLITLATHFAQVQFRLKQIMSAEPRHKELLLKELEEFAFRKTISYDTVAEGERGSTEAQQRKQAAVMAQLSHQLDQLAECAQEGGSDSDQGGVAASLANKQRIIIDELRRRFNLQFGDLEQLSDAEVRESVDKAMDGTMRPKEQRLTQLQTQVKDLERYVSFLRANSAPGPRRTPPPHHAYSDSSPSPPQLSDSDSAPRFRHILGPQAPLPPLTQLGGVRCAVDVSIAESRKEAALHEQTPSQASSSLDEDLRLSVLLMYKTLQVVQVLWQCGAATPPSPGPRPRLKYHAALRSLQTITDTITVLSSALSETSPPADMRIAVETDLFEAVSMSLADSLRALLEHGLLKGAEEEEGRVGCVPGWMGGWWERGAAKGDCPAWKVFKHYYHLKKGDDFSSRPEQLLVSSFALTMDRAASAKKTLLSCIHQVEGAFISCQHQNRDTKFRALVSEGFNLGCLSEWCRLLSANPAVAELYRPSSFLASTGFRPALACLERLPPPPPTCSVSLPSDFYHSAEAFQS